MYLVDTNVFLEVLLTQEKRQICRNFLDANVRDLYISDFSLHSIGVILFRNNREDIFQKFVSDIIPDIGIIALPKRSYEDLAEIKERLGLDFDDTYQYGVAKEYDLEIVTMDRDFEKAGRDVSVRFL
jgi:predicted nucleic acid-binding protein